MSRFRHFLWGLIVLTSISGQAQTPDSVYKLLWRISGNGLEQPSWLFGTFHTRDERAFRFPDSLMIAIDEAEVFSMEIDPDSLMDWTYRLQLAEFSKKGGGEHLFGRPRALGPDRKGDVTSLPYEQLPFLESWLYEPNGYMNYSSRSKYPTFLDAFLYRVADMHGKAFEPVETLDEQITTLTGIMADGLNSEGSGVLGLLGKQRKLIAYYREGDLFRLDTLMKELYEGRELGYYQLITRRNYIMADRISRMIRHKSHFVAIGAGHLPGDEGVIQLLKAKGFSVTPVEAVFSGREYVFKNGQNPPEWIGVTSGHGIVNAKMPNQPVIWPCSDWGGYFILSPDITAGSAYFLLDFDLSQMTEVPKMKTGKILKDFGTRVEKSPGMSLVESASVSFADLKGRRWLVKTKSGMMLDLRLGLDGSKGVVAGAVLPPGFNSHTDSEQFFQSLSAGKGLPENRSQWVKDSLAGFQVRFPGKVLSSTVPLNVEGRSFSDLVVNSTFSGSTGTQYTAFSFAPPGGYFLDDDSAYLAMEYEDLLGTTFIEPDTFFYRKKAGIPMIEGMGENVWHGRKTRFKLLLRGSRMIELYATGKNVDSNSAEIDAFFDSFELIQPKMKQGQRISDSEKAFSAWVSGPFNLAEDTFSVREYGYEMSPFLEYRETWTMEDPFFGNSYLIIKDQFNEAFGNQSDTTLFELAVREIVDYPSVIELDYLRHEEDYWVAGYRELNDRSSTVRFVTCYWNGKYFISQVYLRNPQNTNPIIEKFENSFSVRKMGTLTSVFEDKKEVFFEKLPQLESSEIPRYNEMFDYLQLDSGDQYLVRESILRLKDKNDPAFNQLRNQLISWIGEFDPGFALKELERQYDFNQEDQDQRRMILTQSIGLDTREGTLFWLDKLVNDPPEIETYFEGWALVSSLADSMRHADIIFPRILQATANEDLKPFILELTAIAADSGWVNPREFPDLYPELIQVFGRMRLHEITDEGLVPHYYYGDYLRLLKYFPYGPLERDLLDRFIDSIPNSFDPELLLVLANREDSRAYQVRDSILKYRRGLRGMYAGLKLIDRLDLLDSVGLDQKWFALADLQEYLEEYEGFEVSDLEVEWTMEEDWISGARRFFLISFSVDGESMRYAGLAGPFSLDPNVYESGGEATGTLYEFYDPDQYVELTENLLMKFMGD